MLSTWSLRKLQAKVKANWVFPHPVNPINKKKKSLFSKSHRYLQIKKI